MAYSHVHVSAAAAAAHAQRMRLAGPLIKLDPAQFVSFVERFKEKGIIVVHGIAGIFSKKHVYITAYHGLVFYCETRNLLPIRVDVEAKQLRIY